MSKRQHRADISNPFSTGGGGVNYEISVQTYFAASMILEWKILNLKAEKIKKIKLQGRYEGYDTDDCIIYGDNGNKLLCQIKHSISISKKNKTLKEVIEAAWNDFNDPELFNEENDGINVIVSGLSKVDIESMRSIYGWANSCENEEEFIKKIYTDKFSSKDKIDKFEILKYCLSKEKEDITNEEIWHFLRIFRIEILDVDSPNTYIKSSYMSALDKLNKGQNFGSELYCYVADKNQNAGTITIEHIREDMTLDTILNNTEIQKDRRKLIEHSSLIIENMRSEIEGVTISRTEETDRINNMLEENQLILISGERGVGKSGVAKEYWKKYCKNKYYLALRAEEFRCSSIQGIFIDIGVNSNITDIFNNITLCGDKVIFIESLEKVLEIENNRAFLDFLSIISKHPEWKVVATARDYAIEQIIMNFIGEYKIKYDVFEINEFSRDQVYKFIMKFPTLNGTDFNDEILELMRLPFYLSSIYKIISNGYVLKESDNKQTIKNIIWENVIKKNYERSDGLPYKRESTFTEIALKRCSTMAYAVDVNLFDYAAITKLEEDGLISEKDGFVWLSHDVFEDWAIEKYIEKQYHACNGNIEHFFDSIGCEQSMCRAYRLWLNEKDDIFINQYIKEIFSANGLKNIWYDETLSSIIFSSKAGSILDIMEDELFKNNCNLLKRFCFMIRVVAKKPETDLSYKTKNEQEVKKTPITILRPYGESWREIITFLYKNRSKLPSHMNIHCFKLLKEWSALINIRDELPSEAREVGLLSLFIIDRIRNDYSDREILKGLFLIAMMTYNSISNEFNNFIDETIFSDSTERRESYIDNIAELLYSSIETSYIAKNNPDLLLKVVKNEWYINKEKKDQDFFHNSFDDFDINKRYGLKSSIHHDYFPPSGFREPFRSLFRYNQKKALDFIIELCNYSAQKFIDNSLADYNEKVKTEVLDKIVYTITKEDGSSIKQYGTNNFWVAYRGMGNTPYIIQSALMAMENILINHFEYFKDNKKELDYCIDYIISKSNSVLTTAVLASVVMPYYKNVGKSALLLLQNNDFFDMDISRRVQEMGDKEINWFGMRKDILKEFYEEERRQAATRKWRKQTLEDFCLNIQFTELKDDVWKIIDKLNNDNKMIKEWNFRLNRIDIRKYEYEVDEKNNQIIFTSGKIQDKDLVKMVDENEKNKKITNDFWNAIAWANNAKKGNFDFSIYKNVSNIIEEVKRLIENYKKLSKEERLDLYSVGITECIAIIYMSFGNELNQNEKKWCKDFLIEHFTDYDDSLKNRTYNGRIDNIGILTIAESIPCICKDLSDSEKKEFLTRGLTSCDLDVRIHTAKGIGKFIWNFDSKLAEWCISVVEQFDIDDQAKVNEISYDNNKTNSYLKFINSSRKKLTKINDFSKLTNSKTKFSLYSTTEKMMILPRRYNEKFDNMIMEVMNRIILAESEKDNSENGMYYELLNLYTESFGYYLYQMNWEQVEKYMNVIKQAASNAPYFMSGTLVQYRLLAERNNNIDKYWQFFHKISDIMTDISNNMKDGETHIYDEKAVLLLEYMCLNMQWKEIDLKNPIIVGGIKYICEFTKKSNHNVIVFEGIASLMYYFPNLILKDGILTFKNLSEKEIRCNLKKSSNSMFYLENVLHTYVMNIESRTISKEMYDICEKILNALVESASSKAYYTRDYLMKSKKIG